MFNIQKAVSRLPYAPKLNEIEVTDIKKGLGVFTPLSDKPVSFADLKANLKKAGYVLASADITVSGKLSEESGKWFITSDASGQKFALDGKGLAALTKTNGSTVEITGLWTTVGKAPNAYESIDPQTTTPKAAVSTYGDRVYFVNASYVPAVFKTEPAETPKKPAAPIRTTSPGLTVYKGGAFTPRVYFIKQHLAGLDVNRQVVDLSVSYTPTSHVQLELEVPFSRTSFNTPTQSGSGWGFANITAWAKYRFFRTVKTYGDRQASARLGLELPTGKSSFPTFAQLTAPAFVRGQLGSINGGFSPTVDVSFSQAGGKVIFGGNVQATYRTERDGFRLGHEAWRSTPISNTSSLRVTIQNRAASFS